MKLFVSYSHNDKAFVNTFVSMLKDDVSQHDVWIDTKLVGGQPWWDAILNRVEMCECFVWVLSIHSVASIFCIAEYEYARALNKPVLPVIINDCDVAADLSRIQYINAYTGDISIEKTLRSCEKALGEIRIDLLNNKYLPPTKQPSRPPLPGTLLANVPETIDLDMEMISNSKHTKRAYQRWICQYIADANSVGPELIDSNSVKLRMLIPHLTQETLKIWLAGLQTANKSPETLNIARSSITWIAQWLADRGFIEATTVMLLSRAYRAPKQKTITERPLLTRDKVMTLIHSVLKVSENGAAIDIRDAVIILLLATCSLRRNEAVSLVWNDIIDNNGRYYLHIGSKEKNKRRLPLSQITVDAFERWRELQVPVNGRHPVLTRIIKGGTITRTRLDDHSIVAILHKAAQRAGLPKITPDELRFASARVAYEAGMPLEVIQQMLGHTSFTTTAKYLRIEAGHSMEIDDIWSEELWE